MSEVKWDACQLSALETADRAEVRTVSQYAFREMGLELLRCVDMFRNGFLKEPVFLDLVELHAKTLAKGEP